MKTILLFSLLLTLSCSSQEKPISRIAFGSCSKHDLEQPIWDAVLGFKPELWIWMGDNIYGNSRDPEVLISKYSQQKVIPGYVALREACPVIGTWDDHDYGKNNAGKEYPSKVASQKAMLDFLDEPADSPRRTQKGVYWSHLYESRGNSVQIILLDVRYFRDIPNTENGDILGEAQWSWLETTLEQTDADLTLIVSGIQVLQEDHRYEKWANFPDARKRLLDLVSSNPDERVIFLSGDRHISQMASLEHGSGKAELVEITSSGMTHSWTNFPGETNRHRIRDVYSEINFGTAEINWNRRSVKFDIRGLDGTSQRSLKLDF